MFDLTDKMCRVLPNETSQNSYELKHYGDFLIMPRCHSKVLRIEKHIQLLDRSRSPVINQCSFSYRFALVMDINATVCVTMQGSICIWVRSRNCGCLVTWFCFQMIAKPGNKTATVPWPDPYAPSQWETTLHCNVVSHRLGAYTKTISAMYLSQWPLLIWHASVRNACIARQQRDVKYMEVSSHGGVAVLLPSFAVKW